MKIRNPGWAMSSFIAIQRVIHQILERPERWRKIDNEARWVRAQRFPFAVIYRLRGNAVEILAVTHLRREPGYWRKQLTS